jgi:hypothetical protein
MRGAQPVRTTFIRADQSSLYVRRTPAVANHQFERFDKSDVLEVLADHGLRAWQKGAIIGAVSGVAIALVGVAGCTGTCDTGGKGGAFLQVGATTIPVGIAIGVGIGAAIDAGRGSNVIYRAP